MDGAEDHECGEIICECQSEIRETIESQGVYEYLPTPDYIGEWTPYRRGETLHDHVDGHA